MNTIALNHIAQLKQTKHATIKANVPTTTIKSTTAKRLINIKNISHEKWLEVRKQGIGSSDAAAACGIHPYLSMLELWMIKTGRLHSHLDLSLIHI